MLASLGKSELARQVQYLKAENEILRSKLPKRVTVTPVERRRLLKLGRRIGPALKHLITIVTYRTFLRWIAGDKTGRTSGKRGRPRTDEEIREIIIRLAEENGWGYTRILGELKKLGIRRVCRSTVINRRGWPNRPGTSACTWRSVARRPVTSSTTGTRSSRPSSTA